MSTLTPKRVRGKRDASDMEKWHAGKKRKLARDGSATPSERSSADSTSSRLRQKRARRDPALSRLESLPTEILQMIFQLSANVELPLASRHLAAQLTSNGLFHRLTAAALDPIIYIWHLPTDRFYAYRVEETLRPTDVQLRSAERLMNSRMFTWAMLDRWVQDQLARVRKERRGSMYTHQLPDDAPTTPGVWQSLWPDRHLRVPSKVLRGPWTSDRSNLMACLIARPKLDPIQMDDAQEGLREAVDEGAVSVIQAFIDANVLPTTELLRHAVIDMDCNFDVVRALTKFTDQIHTLEDPPVDYHDPAVWAWAENAKRNGDQMGAALILLLRKRAHTRREAQEAEAIRQARRALERHPRHPPPLND